jgi:hypothetical protein
MIDTISLINAESKRFQSSIEHSNLGFALNN